MHSHAAACRAWPWLLLGVGMLSPWAHVVYAQTAACPTIPQQASGQVSYTAPGVSCSFVPPPGVTSVSVVCVGGGGGAGRYIPFQNPATAGGGSGGGGGGGLVYINNIPVASGLSYPVQVGQGGFGQSSPGGDSFFWNITTMRAGGGMGGIYSGAAPGGVAVASTAYSSRGAWTGGIGGSQGWNSQAGDQPGGGGGAGGYTGAGGSGGALGYPPFAGSGGGGGGGFSQSPELILDTFIAGGGGGVGLLGFNGISGAAGTAADRAGKAGSNGVAGSLPAGGALGGGAGGAIRGSVVSFVGAPGGCRVIWGANRAYPSSNTADVPIGTPSPSPPPPVVLPPSPSPPPPPVVVLPSPPPPVVVRSPPPPPVVVASPPPPPVVVASPPPPPVVVASPPPPPVVVASPPPPPVVLASPPPPPVVVASPPPPPVVAASPPPPPKVVAPSPPPPPKQSSVAGQVVFPTSGTFRWTVPSGVTSVSVVCIGAGGGAGTYVPSAGVNQINGASGGGGGGLAYGNNIPVTSGEVTVIVGAPGAGVNSNGGDSSFTSNVNGVQVIGRGGGGAILSGTNRQGGIGGSWFVSPTLTSRGGFGGGMGGFQSWISPNDLSAGGGGAAGYFGPGGMGGSLVSSGWANPTQGQGGGGGGGWHGGVSGASGGGGGTGLLGLGLSGLAGTANSPGGEGGSGGGMGSNAAASGGMFGGGAGGLVAPIAVARMGGPGGCRIMWGAGRAYPLTRTVDEDGNGVIPMPSPPPPPPQGFPPPITNPPLFDNILTGKRFQYMIGNTGFDVTRDIVPGVTVYNVDGFTTTAEQITAMKARGLIPICYICVGTWEPFRPDTNDFPPSVIGLPYAIEPFTDEKWLDVRTPIVRQLITRRFEMLARKGCMAVEPDNTNGYSSFEQGFDITMLDWKDYIEFLSRTSRNLGMLFGLKNTHEMPRDYPEMVTRPVWDFVVDEGCYTRPEGNGTECDPWRLFKPVNKQVFQVMHTYYWPELTEAEAVVEFRRTICPQQSTYSSVSVLKTVDARSTPFYQCP